MTPSLSQTRLIVFMTRGMSLQQWARHGLLERELALYRALASRMIEVAFMTYGADEELGFTECLGPMRLLRNRWRLPANLYSVLAPLLHAGSLRSAGVFKTNQLNGAWCAVMAKRLFRKPLIVRCGYLWSAHAMHEYGHGWKQRLVERLERGIVRSADRLVVATEADREALTARHGVRPSRIRVIPNYVDTERFCPLRQIEKVPGLVCFIGRLEEQKNPQALLEAIDGLEHVRLMVIGAGSLRSALERMARARKLPVEFLGVVPHEELPAILNRAELFVMPSRYEGHPKALLEAMACGLPVVCTELPGTRGLVRHGETGYLCRGSAAELRSAITELLEQPRLRQELGTNARTYVEQECSLSRILECELALLKELAAPAAGSPGPVVQEGRLQEVRQR